MSPREATHHPYDRAARDALRHATVDFVEVLFDHPLPAGAVAEQTKLEQGELEVDGVVSDARGVKIHVEFQARADRTIGLRMARYWTALTAPEGPAPEQHLVLLHEGADLPGLGEYAHGTMRLTYHVTRLWEIDPELLLARVGLARFAVLGRASSLEQRAGLLARSVRVIKAGLPADRAVAAVAWSAELANLYLDADIIADVFKGSEMPIDLSHTPIAVQAREEGREAGREEGREGQREMIRRVLSSRFGAQGLAARVQAIPDALLLEAIDRAATASAGDFTAWLDSLQP